MDVPHVAYDPAPSRSSAPLPQRAGEPGRAVLPSTAEYPGTVCGKSVKHTGTDARLRRRTAAPTLVRETSQVGLVFGGLDRRHGNTGAGNAGDSHHREGWRDHGYRRDRTKGRTRRSGDGGSGICKDSAERARFTLRSAGGGRRGGG